MLPQQYVDMISSGASLRDFHVALIGELDKVERCLSETSVPIANELELRLREIGMALFEADDGAIFFNVESDINMVKAALCTNFSKEKFLFAEKLMRSMKSSEATSEVLLKNGAVKSPIKGLVDLRTKAEDGEISPSELKMNLKIAILRELDADRQRESPIAEKVAEDAEKKLAKAGERLYEDDDASIEFCLVGRPNVTEDTLFLVKSALQSNFSYEKLHYASELLTEFRRRGYDGYQVKQCKDSNSVINSSAVKIEAVDYVPRWSLAAAGAAAMVVVSLIIKALKK